MKYFDKKNKWRGSIYNFKWCWYIKYRTKPKYYTNNNINIYNNRNFSYDAFNKLGNDTCKSLLILPISAVILKKVIGKIQKYFVKQQRMLRTRKWSSWRVYGGHNIVKVFGRKWSNKKFEKDNQELYKSVGVHNSYIRINASINELCWKCWLCCCSNFGWLFCSKRKNSSW